MIAAYSPEARGRSEHAFATHQGRLPKELALAGITDMAAANRYLRESYMPMFNKEFAQPPQEEGTAFVPFVGGSLNDILCEQYSGPQKSDSDLSYGSGCTKKSQKTMSESKTRKVYSPGFKARVGLEALREGQTINQIAQAHGVHPVQVSQWKKEIQEQASRLFEGKRGPKPATGQDDPERLYGEIGRLKMELDWLKKKSGLSLPT